MLFRRLIQKLKDWFNFSQPSYQVVSAPSPQKTTPTKRKKSQKPSLQTLSEDSGLRKVKLIMVTAENNNKYYEMEENSDGTFTVLYGRVGATQQKRTYNISEWDSKYHEKLNKGYIDQTHLFVKESSSITTESIKNQPVKTLIESFLKYANQSILYNYTVSANQVTRKQVEEAQQIIDLLVNFLSVGLDKDKYNEILLNLFKVIPRKMAKVNEHLINQTPQTEAEIQTLKDQLGNEQATLDVMRTQVELLGEEDTTNHSFLESMGISVEEVHDEKIIKFIKLMMGNNASKFVSAFSINHFKSQKTFIEFIQNQSNQTTTLLWHGSRNENWISILKEGLVLRPANAIITGKMFGYGIYFANEFSKSLNYTSLNGSYWAKGSSKEAYLAIFDVHTGSQKVIDKHESWCEKLTFDKLQKLGYYDSVFAKRGVSLINNEFIVYREAQCTIRYIVKVKP